MVSAGLGVAVMPELMLENCAYPLAACSLEGDFTREIAVCVKDREAVSRSTRLFIEFTKAWVEQNV